MIPRVLLGLHIFSTLIRSRFFLAIVVALVSLPAQGQESAQDQDDDVVRFNVDLVTVNVAVKDHKGRSLLGLKSQDFRITDENTPVVPEFFDSEGPASILFVIDTSSSMQGAKWKSLISGLRDFLKKARDGNDYTLVVFDISPRLLVQSVGGDELLNCLRDLKPDGETALYDGVLLGLDVLQQLPRRHRAVVLITDGTDTSSHFGLAEIEMRASASRTTFYSIGVLLESDCRSGFKGACIGRDTVNKLAKLTGGLAFFPKVWEISPVLKEVSNDVSSQYSLSYYPPDKKSGWRQVNVTLAQDYQRPKLRYQQRYLMK